MVVLSLSFGGYIDNIENPKTLGFDCFTQYPKQNN